MSICLDENLIINLSALRNMKWSDERVMSKEIKINFLFP